MRVKWHARKLQNGLRGHPGVPLVAILVCFGALAGLDRGVCGAAVGAAVMSVFSVPVLITAYQNGRGGEI